MKADQRPVVLLAYANDRVDPSRHLRNLSEEMRRIREALPRAEVAGHCEVLHEPNATADSIFEVFQNAQYRNRVAIFH